MSYISFILLWLMLLCSSTTVEIIHSPTHFFRCWGSSQSSYINPPALIGWPNHVSRSQNGYNQSINSEKQWQSNKITGFGLILQIPFPKIILFSSLIHPDVSYCVLYMNKWSNLPCVRSKQTIVLFWKYHKCSMVPCFKFERTCVIFGFVYIWITHVPTPNVHPSEFCWTGTLRQCCMVVSVPNLGGTHTETKHGSAPCWVWGAKC